MDTNAADIYLNKFFDDSRFLEHDKGYDALPQISGDIDDNFCRTFLKKYISFCKCITSERRDKIRQILTSKKFDPSNCQHTIYLKIKSMIDTCDEKLLPEDKTILHWRTKEVEETSFSDEKTVNEHSEDKNISEQKIKEADDYSSVPNEETIKKWLAETDFRNPNRLYLYKIAFALELAAYFPHEINEDDDRYKTSMNFLFNKVYNQRYVTRTADELIFVFCLKNGKNYLTAMQMLAKYRRICKDIDFSDEVNFQTKSNDTILFLKNNITKNEDEFIDDLIRLTPLLEDKYSSVFKTMEKFIQYFSTNKYKLRNLNPLAENLCSGSVKDKINNISKNSSYAAKTYMNLGSNLLISEILKKNLLFLNNRMMISSALNRNLTPAQNEYLQRTFSDLDLSENLYQTVKDSAGLCINAVIEKYSQNHLSAILSDLIITIDDVYNSDIIHRKPINNNEYVYNPTKRRKKKNDNENVHKSTNRTYSISHNLIYRNMRSALITAHFFCYWSDISSELSAEDYIDEINQILTNNYYLPMYSKNNFDCFFILCTKLYQSKNINPIDVYYKFFDYIYSIYHNYNEFFLSSQEFENYNSLSSCELLVEPEDTDADILSYKDKSIKKCLHKIDDPAVQKEILKVIKKI